MSISTELAKRNQRLEFFLCIEGVGWPSSMSDLSAGFDGDVFATQDFNDLATALGCTVHGGLSIQGGIDQSFDPVTLELQVGSIGFTIDDVDGWWLANFTPRKDGNDDTLGATLSFAATSVTLTTASYADGSVVWIANRECIKLGSKSGSVYSSCTRGYLGTRMGSVRRSPSSNVHGVWRANTSVTDVARWWNGRRVALFAHVPGEAAANCELWWYGKLRAVRHEAPGTYYELECRGDFLSDASRVWRPTWWTLTDEGTPELAVSGDAQSGFSEDWYRTLRFEAASGDGGLALDDGSAGDYALALAYRYRSEPGGLDGAVSSWDSGSVQALDTADDSDVLMSFIEVDGEILLALRAYDAAWDPKIILCEGVSRVGVGDPDLFVTQNQGNGADARVAQVVGLSKLSQNAKARFLLAKWFYNNKQFNRFTVNGRPLFHPIEIGLCFMLSMDRELFRADATGGTATVPTFSGVPPADSLIGYALHCVEGNNKWEAREITDNTTSSITVEQAFSNAPTVGTEYQVRNSIYDVLPAGWGMAIDVHDVDVDSFMSVMDQIPDAKINQFIIGIEDEIDIWEMVQSHLFRPYGVLVYYNRTTRKISARYVGQALGDGLVEDYTAISYNSGHILSAGRVNRAYRQPLGAVVLRTRSVEERIVGTRFNGSIDVYRYGRVAAPVGGDMTSHRIRAVENADAFEGSQLDEVTIEMAFNTDDDLPRLVPRLIGLLGQYSVPPPVWEVTLSHQLLPSLHVGSWAVVTWSNAPVNPFTGTRGWSSVVGRVIGLGIRPNSVELTAKIELFNEIVAGKVAPAAKISSYVGGGAAGSNYVVVNDAEYVADTDNDKDFYYFAVGDLVETRTSAGVKNSSPTPLTIKDFGSNHASTPQAASDNRIYFEEAGVAWTGTPHYITLASWSASNTTRMEEYSAYADASETLTGGDVARKYS